MTELDQHNDIRLFFVFNSFNLNPGVRIPRDGLAIDIGAGTGLSGQALREIVGFTGRIDALEPSTNMFAIAEPKGIYTKYFNELLLEDKVWKYLKVVFLLTTLKIRAEISLCPDQFDNQKA